MESTQPLTIVFSAKALFNLEEAHQIYLRDGLQAYIDHQIAHENDILAPGPGFSFIKSLSQLRHPQTNDLLVKCILLSQTDTKSGMRIFNSAAHHQIQLTRAGFTGGQSQVQYLDAYGSDLFLGTNAADVQQALDRNFAAALLYPKVHVVESSAQVRIAFDGDCVLFGPESEIANQVGWDNFMAKEKENAKIPLQAGPFQRFLVKLCHIQKLFPPEKCPIRTALVTARSIPAHIRPLLTFRHWEINVDEAHFLGGLSKQKLLAAFRPHIFFDDQRKYCEPASDIVTTGRVPHGPHA